MSVLNVSSTSSIVFNPRIGSVTDHSQSPKDACACSHFRSYEETNRAYVQMSDVLPWTRSEFDTLWLVVKHLDRLTTVLCLVPCTEKYEDRNVILPRS